MTNFAVTAAMLQGANKGQLREFMRKAGLAYAGMNNNAMLDALAPYVVAELPAEAPAEEALLAEAPAEVDPPTMLEAEASLQPATEPAEPVEQVAPPPPAPAVPTMVDPLAEYGPAIELRTPPAAPKPARSTLPKQNGIAEPKVGTVCRAIWDYVRSQKLASGKTEAKALRAHGAAQNPPWDPTTCNVQFYRCRKFHNWSE